MKKCEEYELAISCYVDGELAPSDRAKLFGHLSKCESCTAFLEKTIRIRVEAAKEARYKFVEPTSSRASARDALGSRVALPQRMFALMRSRVSLPVPVAAAAAVILIVAGVFFAKPQPTQELTRVEQTPQANAVMSMPTIVISQ